MLKSRYKWSPPTHWDLGFGAKKYKIQIKLWFLLKYLCALLGSPRYPPPLSPILTHWVPVIGANWVPVAGANWVPGVSAQKYKFFYPSKAWIPWKGPCVLCLDPPGTPPPGTQCNFLSKYLCALPRSPRYPPWLPVSGAEVSRKIK